MRGPIIDPWDRPKQNIDNSDCFSFICTKCFLLVRYLTVHRLHVLATLLFALVLKKNNFPKQHFAVVENDLSCNARSEILSLKRSLIEQHIKSRTHHALEWKYFEKQERKTINHAVFEKAV